MRVLVLLVAGVGDVIGGEGVVELRLMFSNSEERESC